MTNPEQSTQLPKIALYGSPFCRMVAPVEQALERAGAEYEYFDIRQDPDARARVREINGGNESVPTLVFPDQTTLTEPSISQLEAQLRRLGYALPSAGPGRRVRTLLTHPLFTTAGLLILAAGLILDQGGLVLLGAFLLLLTLMARRV
jgi:mycoredoxin